MKMEDLTKLAMDSHSFLCYIVDMENYDLLYINENARRTFSPFTQEFEPGRKCYDFLNGFDSPCSFCNNNLLVKGKKLCTVFQNERNGKHYSHIDSLLDIKDRSVKLIYAYETQEHSKEIESHTRNLSVEDTLLKCIRTLVEDEELNNSILNLLSIMCEFYCADRAYIFEIDKIENTVSCVYEWATSTETSIKKNVPVLHINDIKVLTDAFKNNGELIVKNVKETFDNASLLYKILQKTGTHTMQVVPIDTDGSLTYFMGVDNATRSVKDLTLLHSVLIFVADDIKKYKTIKKLEHLSYTDVLTGLGNRNMYLKCLEEINSKNLKSLGCIHININALKRLNELYGDMYGDSILKQASEIFSKYIKKDLFRIAGDEFIALCHNISLDDFEILVSSLKQESKDQHTLSFAVGGVWKEKNIDLRQCLTQANDIMIAEKQNYYKEKSSEKIQTRLNATEILLEEIRSKAFVIYLQPKVDLITGEIKSAEALVRKVGLNGSIISPDKFIPIYENENTISHLDFYVLEEVCKFIKKLMEDGKPLQIAVNFSRSSLLAYNVVDDIISICDKYKIPHQYIKIELTETVDKMDFKFFQKKVAKIKSSGFDISLDDFGADQSNLLMLTMAEFSEIKIDKGLIDNITISAENRTVVRNIIKTIKELRKSSCVAEGIETEEQKELLQNLGCTDGQGYFFYKPMSLHDFLCEYNEKSYAPIKEAYNKNTAHFINYTINYDELYAIIEGIPLCVNVWDSKGNLIACNDYSLKLFDLSTKNEYIENFLYLSPEVQPNGVKSKDLAIEKRKLAWKNGYEKFNWLHRKLNGDEIPCEITLTKLDVKSEDENFFIAGYTRDLRSQLSGYNELELLSFFSQSVNEKAIINKISEISSEFYWVYDNSTGKAQLFGRSDEILGLPVEKIDFPSRVLEKNIVPEEYKDEFLEFVTAMENGTYKPLDVKFNKPDGQKNRFKVDYSLVKDANNEPLFSIGKTTEIRSKE